MTPKLSIIIPVYNVAPYIIRCLDSIANQTIKGLEVILVDDHGQDDSIAIAQQYIQEHKLSKSWHIIATPQNSGPGAARNIGIQAAKGEYIAFCDADDWVESTMYEQLYSISVKTNADMAICNAIARKGTTSKIISNPIFQNSKQYLSQFIAYLWTYCFNREWLLKNNIQFPTARSAEDSSFIGMCILIADRIAQTSEPLYHYVIHSDSISHRKHIWRGKEKRKAFDALNDFAKHNGLWQTYRKELILIYIKKALLTPIKEWIH